MAVLSRGTFAQVGESAEACRHLNSAAMDMAQDILRAEATLRSALLSSDVEALDALLAPTVLWIDVDGAVTSKGDLLAASTAPGRPRIRVLEGHPTVKASNDEAAITVVPANVAGRLDGAAFEGLFLYTRTWVCESGSWKVQSSVCLPGGLGD